MNSSPICKGGISTPILQVHDPRDSPLLEGSINRGSTDGCSQSINPFSKISTPKSKQTFTAIEIREWESHNVKFKAFAHLRLILAIEATVLGNFTFGTHWIAVVSALQDLRKSTRSHFGVCHKRRKKENDIIWRGPVIWGFRQRECKCLRNYEFRRIGGRATGAPAPGLRRRRPYDRCFVRVGGVARI